MMTIHRGTVATSSAAIPEGTVRSAHTTMPLPPRRSAPPTMAADRHWRRVGRSPSRSPRRIAHAYRMAPATRNRMEALRKGGMVRTATRIAR